MLVWVSWTMTGCQSRPDLDRLYHEILELHKKEIAAHWNKDIDFFTKDIAKDYFSVNNGEIRHPTKSAITTQFSNYLNNTTFSSYKDLQEPIIGFSEDGTLAYSIVRMKIAGERQYEDGVERDFDFVCAWITLYRREGESWIRMGEVSSFAE